MLEPKLLNDEQVREFIANGFIRLQADLDSSVHAAIDEQLRYVHQNETWFGNNIVSRVPKMHEVLRCPTVHGALLSLAGPNYYVHPHRAIHRSTPVDDPEVDLPIDVDAPRMGKASSSGSAWHQDAQSPLSRARHHLPRYLIGFYFPHDTPMSMGPTRIQAGSHLYANPVAPRGIVVPEQIRAGTFLLLHFDMVHAGFPNRTDRDRYMVKFVFTRTQSPTAPTWQHRDAEWRRPDNCLTEDDLSHVWRFIWQWLKGSPRPVGNEHPIEQNLANLNHNDPSTRLRSTYALAAQDAIPMLVQSLERTAGKDKHRRKLAQDENGNPAARDDIRGYPRRWNERAVVMEDAAYALGAAGAAAMPALRGLLNNADPWVQINAVFALGEIGPPARDAVADIGALLESDHQQVVRQALDALGCIGCGLTPVLDKIEGLMVRSNPHWQQPQVMRGWTGEDQVRLNAAFALLNAVNAAERFDAIERILRLSLDDKNGYVAAVAAEALVRIGTPSATASAIRYLSDRRWDETLMGRKKPY